VGKINGFFKNKFKILSHYVQTSIGENDHTSFKHDSKTHNQ